MVQPLLKPNRVKKRTKPFVRPQSEHKKRVKPSWRYPRGIDSRTRRGFKGTRPMPNIGYGSDKRTRHMLPSGFYKFVVHRPEDVDLLLMHNRTYAAEIANAVSTKKRKDIVQRARVLNVHVTNANARLKTAESE